MEQPILTKLLLPLNNMRQKTLVKAFAIVAVIGLTLGALLPAFASL